MADDAEGLFVIDKKGTEESQPSNIVYYFKPEEEQQSGGSSLETKPARQRRGPAGKRYHEADDFNKFRPGHISRELRRALNLDRHEIPLHVYRMRSLGYPPGWLRKAKVGDGLMIFDSITALAEDKEVSVTYNRDALISYPGFNTQLDYPYIDQSLQLHCPPMQSHHMLDNFYAALSRNSRWRSNQNDSKLEEPLDLDKLREERERILAEIRRLDPNIIVSQSFHESDDVESQLDRDDKEGHSDEHNACRSKESPNPSSQSNSEVTQADNNLGFGDVDNQIFSISASEEGTPTPQRFYCSEDDAGNNSLSSEPAKRPSIDAFTVGVQPFRPFENLPGSQGGYQRVLQTLRHSRSVKSLSSHSSGSSNGINNSNSNYNTNNSCNNSGDDRSSHSSSTHTHSPNQYVSRNGHHRVSGSGPCSSSSQFRGVRSYRYGHHY